MRLYCVSWMAISSFPSRRGVPRLSLRIWRANSKWGTMTSSPRDSRSKVSSSSSMSSSFGDS